jgi:hypothetical protein
MPITLQPLTRDHAASFCSLVIALAQFEKLVPPDAAAQERLVKDALSERPRIELWLAFVDGSATPCGYLILVETYSSFLALPTLYIEDVFVLPEHRGAGGRRFAEKSGHTGPRTRLRPHGVDGARLEREHPTRV